jgi:hypothetical protein
MSKGIFKEINFLYMFFWGGFKPGVVAIKRQ